MARIDLPDGDGMEVSKVWGLVPHMAEAIHTMSKAVYEKEQPANPRA